MTPSPPPLYTFHIRAAITQKHFIAGTSTFFGIHIATYTRSAAFSLSGRNDDIITSLKVHRHGVGTFSLAWNNPYIPSRNIPGSLSSPTAGGTYKFFHVAVSFSQIYSCELGSHSAGWAPGSVRSSSSQVRCNVLVTGQQQRCKRARQSICMCVRSSATFGMLRYPRLYFWPAAIKLRVCVCVYTYSSCSEHQRALA